MPELPAELTLRTHARVVWDGASVTNGDVDEIWRCLPGSFIEGLIRLLVLARNDGLGGSAVVDVGRASARAVTRVSTTQTETRGPAKPGGRAAPRNDPLRSMAAQRLLDKTTRRLRTMGREMIAFSTVADGGVVRSGKRRCSRCKTFADADWLYCPKDGAPTEETD